MNVNSYASLATLSWRSADRRLICYRQPLSWRIVLAFTCTVVGAYIENNSQTALLHSVSSSSNAAPFHVVYCQLIIHINLSDKNCHDKMPIRVFIHSSDVMCTVAITQRPHADASLAKLCCWVDISSVRQCLH